MPGLAGHHTFTTRADTRPHPTWQLLLLLYYIGDAASACGSGDGTTRLLHHIPKHPKTGSLGYSSRLTVYVRFQLLPLVCHPALDVEALLKSNSLFVICTYIFEVHCDYLGITHKKISRIKKEWVHKYHFNLGNALTKILLYWSILLC